MRASGAEAALRGKALTVDALVTAMEELQHDISPGDTPGVQLPRSAVPSLCHCRAGSLRNYDELTANAPMKLASKARIEWALHLCADGGTEVFYRSAAEGLLLQALGPLLAGDTTLPCKLKRLLASAKKLGDPGVAEGKQTYPDYSSIAPPAHENVEKDRVHLMVSLAIPCCAPWFCESPTRSWQSYQVIVQIVRYKAACTERCGGALQSGLDPQYIVHCNTLRCAILLVPVCWH